MLLTVKARIATVLSLAGVIVAGSAAALVNNQVLRSTEPADTSTFISASSSTTASTLPDSSVSTATTVAPTTLRVYDIDKVGRVTMDLANGNLRLVEAKEFDGWAVSKLVQTTSTDVEVRFSNVLGTVVFTATLKNGEIETHLEVEGADTTSSSVAPSSSTGGTTNTGGTTATTDRPRVTSTSVDDDQDDDSGSGKGSGGGGDDKGDDD